MKVEIRPITFFFIFCEENGMVNEIEERKGDDALQSECGINEYTLNVPKILWAEFEL